MVQLPLSKGANIKSVTEVTDGRYTAIAFAAMQDHEGVIRLLLGEGVDFSAEDGYGKIALNYAKEKKQKGVISLLSGTESAESGDEGT